MTASPRAGFMLHVGDIAYTSGSETEFTDFHFTMYQDILRHTTHWPTLGNHEGPRRPAARRLVGPRTTTRSCSRRPRGGRCASTPRRTTRSATATHFISLNSRSAARPRAHGDVAPNDLPPRRAVDRRVLAPPPYTHGTHNSDTKVSCARCVEHPADPPRPAASTSSCGHRTLRRSPDRRDVFDPTHRTSPRSGHRPHLDDSSGKLRGTVPTKGSGAASHARRSLRRRSRRRRQGNARSPRHVLLGNDPRLLPAGRHVNTLTLTNVGRPAWSAIRSRSSGPQSPRSRAQIRKSRSDALQHPSGVPTGVTGVDAGNLSVNGSPATSMTGRRRNHVHLQRYALPPMGTSVWSWPPAASPTDEPGLQFTGNVWSYTIDTTPPRVAARPRRQG
jgi:hypothetical protein